MVSGFGFWYPMAALMPARAVHKLRIVFTRSRALSVVEAFRRKFVMILSRKHPLDGKA